MWSSVRELLGDDATAILATATAVVALVARVFWMVRRG